MITMYATREEGEITYWGLHEDDEFNTEKLDWDGFDKQIEENKEYEITIDADECDSERGTFYTFTVIEIKQL